MPIHHFVPPIELPSSLVSRTGTKRKRSSPSSSSDSSASIVSPPSPPLPITADSTSDSRLDDVPRDFPHAPLPDSFVPKYARQTTQPRNLKQQHFHVLTTILHRCLQDHDSERAGKAFALLLSFEISGRRVNLRQRGLWGIGAEILLRNGRLLDGDASGSDGDETAVSEAEVGVEVDDEDRDFGMSLSVEGFKAAKAFYDRLIVQYPYRKTMPKAVGARDFYPAMFGVWIMQAQSQSLRAQRWKSVMSSELGSDVGLKGEGDVDGSNNHHQARILAAKMEELSQARDIAAALQGLTLGPPFDRNTALLKLQGRVALWMSDLIGATSGGGQDLQVVRLVEGARRALRKAKENGARLTESEMDLIEEEARSVKSGSS